MEQDAEESENMQSNKTARNEFREKILQSEELVEYSKKIHSKFICTFFLHNLTSSLCFLPNPKKRKKNLENSQKHGRTWYTSQP